jgi:uncharacterized protein (TIGR02757 family)
MQFASSRARARDALSSGSVEQLKIHLNALLAGGACRGRIRFDPVELPHRYSHPQDIEVAALLSASLAYGRADLFKPKVDFLLAGMGSSPAAFACNLTVRGARALLEKFVYRFNVGTDIAVLLMGAGRALRERGSLEALFKEGLNGEQSLHDALSAFTRALRRVPLASLRRELGPERGLDHLLPSPLGPGAAKRLNMFLRWMVRGPDDVDFGIWRSIPTSKLLVPVDTHVGRIARYLGLTRRKDLSWRTAEEITTALSKIDPADPVRFDFALCHHGMSGACPPRPRLQNCSSCALRGSCSVGRRLLGIKLRRWRS